MSGKKLKDPKDLDGVFFKLGSKDDDIVEILCKVKDRSTFIKNAMVYYYKALKQNPSLVERSIVIDEYDIPIFMQQAQPYSNQMQPQFIQNSPIMNYQEVATEENTKLKEQAEDNTILEPEIDPDDINSYNTDQDDVNF